MSERSQAAYARCAIECAIDEVEELLHINRYMTGHVYEARHFLTKALIEIERLCNEDEGRIR